MDKRCETCRWFVLDEELDGKYDSFPDYGGCHKHAPVIVHGSATGWSGQKFPQLHKDDGCGDWLKKEGKQ